MRKNKYNDDDRNIADFVAKELPRERIDPWFTKKVLNRLPPHRTRHSIVEKCLVLITTIGVLIGFILESIHIGTTLVITVGDLIMMGAFLLSFLFLGCWIVIPLIRN